VNEDSPLSVQVDRDADAIEQDDMHIQVDHGHFGFVVCDDILQKKTNLIKRVQMFSKTSTRLSQKSRRYRYQFHGGTRSKKLKPSQQTA
jgi:hypothetical protein